MTINVKDTGVRGYLKWLQADQPNVYAKVAPIIAQKFPQAFSDHEQSVALGYLSDDAPGVTTYFGDSSGGGGASAAAGPDVANAANTGATSPSLANDIANLVTAATTAASQYQLTQAQIAAVNNLNQAQAQHMAAGNPPLQISSSSLGIPFISGGTTATAAAGGTLLVGIAGALGLAWLFGKRKGA